MGTDVIANVHNVGNKKNSRSNNDIVNFCLLCLGIPFNQGSWRQARRFALQSMKNFGLGKELLDKRITDEALTLAKQFYGRNSQAFDPQDDLCKAVSNIICSTTFGKR